MADEENNKGGLAGLGGRGPVDPFEVRGELAVKDSATVICVRRRPPGCRGERPTVGFAEQFKRKFGKAAVEAQPFLRGYLGGEEFFQFESDWEVLLGQSEVINWLRSTPDHMVTMRYPGEFKLAGGNVDGGESLEHAAKRELEEEFLRPAETQVPRESIILRPFSVKQTRPIRSRSNLMYNYVAVAEENPWLNNLDIDEINSALAARRAEFTAFLKLPDCPYFAYPRVQKEAMSPEVYQLRWVPLQEAVEHCLTSVLPDVYVNEWQREEFFRVARTRRDPLIMTGATLIELEMFADLEALTRYCDNVSFEELRAEEQWLFPGMTNDEVVDTFRRRLGPEKRANPSFRPLKNIAERRARNRTAAAPARAGKL